MNSSDRKDINIGMTFYGGVSLAVYEAGVAEEFIRFIQFCKENKGDFDLPDVNVKVISGTSAGGLAAVLMSAALANAKDPREHIEEMRRIWFDVADLSELQYKWDDDVCSLLKNDILEEKVKDFLQIEDGNGMCEDVKIILTGTNMQGFFDAIPVEHNFTSTGDYAERAIPTIRHTEVFDFDWKKIKDEKNKKEEWFKRIAKAARITSSFPGAFPPQFVKSPSFSEATNPPSFWYFDGGVLDNKPLGHAIDRMESSSDGGEWWYFFVEPDPDEEKKDFEKRYNKWRPDPNDPPDPVSTALTVLSVRGAETIYHDLRRIQKMNHQIQQVNGLLMDIWNTLRNGTPEMHNKIIEALEENIKTARLHRFLPDYLKCATMLRYNFVREEKKKMDIQTENELKDRHRNIVDKLLYPLDLRKIIEECCEYNQREEDERWASEETIVAIKTFLKESAELKNYDSAANEVRKTQLLFRQIAFWVEDDYNKDKILSEKTKKTINEATENLDKTLKELEAKFTDVYSEIKGIIQDYDLLRKVILFVRLNEALHASAGLETREKINIVRVYHDKDKHGLLAGGNLGHFGGFLEKKWRMNDYKAGIADTREMLEGRMKKVFSDAFWQTYKDWRKKKDKEITKYPLPDKPLEPHELDVYNLPASKTVLQIDGLLKATKKVIKKYEERPVYKQLKLVQVNLLLTITRFFLWLIRHATAQPINGKDIRTMADFNDSGKRYMGFTGIGFIIGLAAAFFLPDMSTRMRVFALAGIASIVTFISTKSRIIRGIVIFLIAVAAFMAYREGWFRG